MATGFSVMDALNKNSKAGLEETTPKARFRTKDISLYKIYSSSMNFYPQDGIEEKAGEILALGLLENLVVKYEPCELGEYKLISGERRWRSLKLLCGKGYKEFEMVTCQIRTPANEHEEKIELIIANSNRVKTMSTLIREEQELKTELQFMKDNKIELRGYDLQSGRLRDVISDILKTSKTRIAQMEAVSNNLIPEFMKELNNERLTFSAAYELQSMSIEEQRAALETYMETGELTYKTIKDMKEQKEAEQAAAQIEGQMVIDEDGEVKENGEAIVSMNDQLDDSEEQQDSSEEEPEEFEPQPEKTDSLCYSCKHWNECDMKSNTVFNCNEHINKAETEKTAEQIYSEEQDAIDKETAKKLRDMADDDKMNNLPSDTQSGQKVHQIRIAAMYFNDACSGKKPFELRKNDRHYKEGDILEMMEFKDGKNTGRIVRVLVTYLLEDYTGLEEDYCIMGTKVIDYTKENE